MRFGIIAVVALGAFLLLGQSMAFGKSFVLASPMEGRLVTESGAPVANVRVTRRWVWGWNSKTGTDETTTDAEGRFAFDKVTGRSFAAGLAPHTPSVLQEYKAYPESGEVLILDLDKRNYDMDGELQGQKLKVRCRTDMEAGAHGFFWGTCEYDG